jgi:YhcH/YjgK/YiaL family protein
MRFLIWGAGAIGGTMGAHLARAGHDVTLVDTVDDHVAAINRSGLHITGPIADFTARIPAFTPSALAGRWDAIILATKAQHTDAAAHALLPHLSADGCVISAQNGLNELAIAAIVGAERTVGAFVNFGADYIEPGVVHYGGRGAVVVGEIDGDRLYALVSRGAGRGRREARLETHNKYIDVQYVVSGVDMTGWKPVPACRKPAGPFDAEKDVGFFEDEPEAWIAVHAGSLAVYFPEDAHMPRLSAGEIHKVVVKVAVG